MKQMSVYTLLHKNRDASTQTHMYKHINGYVNIKHLKLCNYHWSLEIEQVHQPQDMFSKHHQRQPRKIFIKIFRLWYQEVWNSSVNVFVDLILPPVNCSYTGADNNHCLGSKIPWQIHCALMMRSCTYMQRQNEKNWFEFYSSNSINAF